MTKETPTEQEVKSAVADKTIELDVDALMKVIGTDIDKFCILTNVTSSKAPKKKRRFRDVKKNGVESAPAPATEEALGLVANIEKNMAKFCEFTGARSKRVVKRWENIKERANV